MVKSKKQIKDDQKERCCCNCGIKISNFTFKKNDGLCHVCLEEEQNSDCAPHDWEFDAYGDQCWE